MGDRATLEKIYVIMRRLLLIKLDGLNPIPRKGTTRRECYRALYEIQELLETRRYFGKHLQQTNADRLRAMTDEELASYLCKAIREGVMMVFPTARYSDEDVRELEHDWLDWLRQEEQDG